MLHGSFDAFVGVFLDVIKTRHFMRMFDFSQLEIIK